MRRAEQNHRQIAGDPIPPQVLVSFHPEDQATGTLLYAHLGVLRYDGVTVGRLMARPDEDRWALLPEPGGWTGWDMPDKGWAEYWLKKVGLVVAVVSAPYLAAAVSPPVQLLPAMAGLRAQGLQVLAVAARPCAAERVLSAVELANDPKRPLSCLRLPQREAFFVELVDVVADRLRNGVAAGGASSDAGRREEAGGNA